MLGEFCSRSLTTKKLWYCFNYYRVVVVAPQVDAISYQRRPADRTLDICKERGFNSLSLAC